MNVKINLLIAAAAAIFFAGCVGQPTASPTFKPPTLEPTVAVLAETPPTTTPLPPTSTPTIPAPTATLAPLDMDSDIEAILERMIHSHETWQSLWIQFQAVKFPPQGSDDNIGLARLQVWMRQPAEVLLLCGSLGDVHPDYIFISDGSRFLEAELRTGFENQGEIALDPLGIFFPQVENQEKIFYCPPEGIVLNMVKEMIFPAVIAQREGTYEMVGEDSVARRNALVVEFRAQPDDLIFDRYWIDVMTGMVLEHHVIDMTSGSVWVISELSVFPIVYDPVYAPDLFKLEMPEVVNFQEAPQ
jgi:hypothetical protein